MMDKYFNPDIQNLLKLSFEIRGQNKTTLHNCQGKTWYIDKLKVDL